jgi:hypothetical protein
LLNRQLSMFAKWGSDGRKYRANPGYYSWGLERSWKILLSYFSVIRFW